MIITILMLPFTMIGFFMVYSLFNIEPLNNLTKRLNRFNNMLVFETKKGYCAKNKLEAIKFAFNIWKKTR